MKVQPRVFIAKCSKPQTDNSNVAGGDSVIYGYKATTYPIANSMFEEWKEKYTEVRIGSKDGIAIARIRIYGAHYTTVEDYDDEGKYLGQHLEYSSVCVQGEVLDAKFTKVIFELLPNVEGYTDSEGKWICTEKSLNVCTFSHYVRNDYNQPDIGYGASFTLADYCYDESERVRYSYALAKNKNESTDYGFYFFATYYDLKYDIEITGNVMVYRYDSRDRSTKLIPTQSFMTVWAERTNEQDDHYYIYIFVLQEAQQVIMFNGKAFSLDKVPKV